MKTKIYRGALDDKEKVKEHILKIGQTIIDSAGDIAFDPHLVKELTITARVGAVDITTIEWKVTKIADPRVKENGDGEL